MPERRETSSATPNDYVNLVTVRGGGHAISGTLVGRKSEQRIVMVDEHSFDVPPAETMVLVKNDDRPGVIGTVGTLLGNAGVNIADMDVGRAAQAGTAWQIFPNFQIGHAVNNMLCYMARPFGNDPDKCIFEAAVYELYPKGQEPQTEWEHTPPDDPRWRSVLPQDFSNMAAVQQGMKNVR